MARRWNQLAGAGRAGARGGDGGGGSGSMVLRVTLVHNTVTTVAHPTASGDGQLLVVLLQQPSNAAGEVAWDGSFSPDTPTEIDTATNDSIARVVFVWSDPDSKWIFIVMNAGGTL